MGIMKITISGKNIDVTEGLKAAVNEKLGKLEKYFTPDTNVIVTLSVEKERQRQTFSNSPSPYCTSRKTTTVYRQARYDSASSRFRIRAEKNKERYGSVAAAKALPNSQNSTR